MPPNTTSSGAFASGATDSFPWPGMSIDVAALAAVSGPPMSILPFSGVRFPAPARLLGQLDGDAHHLMGPRRNKSKQAAFRPEEACKPSGESFIRASYPEFPF